MTMSITVSLPVVCPTEGGLPILQSLCSSLRSSLDIFIDAARDFVRI